MARILVAEDDPHLCNLLQITLEDHGHSVLAASDGEEAFAIFEAHPVDLALLDIILPRLTGLEVCRMIRETSDIPIVMLTGLNTPDYMTYALADFGADDYIVKPTTFKEIVIRIEALLRRVEWSTNPITPDEIVIGKVRLSHNPQVLEIDGQEFHLGEKQHKILQILLQFANKPVMYETLLSEVWEADAPNESALSDATSNKKRRAKLYNTIRRLRILIEDDPANPQYIHAAPGYGYIFNIKK